MLSERKQRESRHFGGDCQMQTPRGAGPIRQTFEGVFGFGISDIFAAAAKSHAQEHRLRDIFVSDILQITTEVSGIRRRPISSLKATRSLTLRPNNTIYHAHWNCHDTKEPRPMDS
ncbi:hypothetical protein [Paraburkholderia sp. CNPSo 3281]|uniref:hypothetical protein n=1 Tax=Paraburkholderia sp. CNPSo 3281 TaxID=2940933 RepID=UPI0020B7A3F1|nr:hypothetical protein [Paraburkholderia sp. CNPSo 3281]MCP3717968.1 hypothetical protein [Paraburkholderia sp. CNPSo 3281]